VFITVLLHRRIPYLKNLVGQVAPQALPDAYETAPKWHGFYDYTGRFGSRVKQRTAEYRITNIEFRRMEALCAVFLK
jgi:hypothetical protein